jgi:tetratricopeptide (TPR) repeat protein
VVYAVQGLHAVVLRSLALVTVCGVCDRQEAGQAYEQVAEINSKKLKDFHGTQGGWENAAKAYKNVNLRAAVGAYTRAVSILMENNKFAQAAKLWKEMGVLYEKEYNTNDACKAYQKAADWSGWQYANERAVTQ